MKKLMFLLVAGTMFVFTACNCGACADDCAKECCTEKEGSCSDDCAKECCTNKVVVCDDGCQKACCLGCKAEEGEKRCDLLAGKYKKHSCCSSEGVTLVETKPHTHDDDDEPHTH